MKLQRIVTGIILAVFSVGCQKNDQVVRIAVTTDVHGMIFPEDLIEREASDHSLAHIYNYVAERGSGKDTAFLLLDNGDFLQGQPTVYYFNFLDTVSAHISARVMNYLGYDAASVGNHDIEAGPSVYDRIRTEMAFPWLAANAVVTATGEPYFDPYTILKAEGAKIAVLGLITPGIPGWLPKNLWPGMEFRDMVESAREWIPRILEEDPDLVVGLFHSGTDAGYGGDPDPYMNENATLLVAREVPGFDVIFAGHDHRVSGQWVENMNGDSVLVIDPGSHARFAGEVTVTFGTDGTKHIRHAMIPLSDFKPSERFLESFNEEYQKVTTYLDDTVTWVTETMNAVDGLFGPSEMASLIHRVQLELSGAELSFTAPLSISATIEAGPLLVSDLFKLYRFENMLYSMELSGKEIDGFLEHAAGIWFNTMQGPGDHLLLFSDGGGRLENPAYNFSSAAGIDYTIDVSRLPGDRVTIRQFSNGRAFSEDSLYRVAINSYRGNGGGGHLTDGSGIPPGELAGRTVWSSDVDLRYYIMLHLSGLDTLRSGSLHNWQLEPADWVPDASRRDRKLLE